MTKKIIISLPSKGRIRTGSLKIFKEKGLNIKFEKGDRDLIGQVTLKKLKIVCIFQHARESINALANSTADIAISGIDLLQNSDLEVQKKIKIFTNRTHCPDSLPIMYLHSCQEMTKNKRKWLTLCSFLQVCHMIEFGREPLL